MAAYIYESGDEETVASTVENYLQLGIVGISSRLADFQLFGFLLYKFYFLQLDREQALVYLQRIKTILDELRAQEVRNKKRVSSFFNRINL